MIGILVVEFEALAEEDASMLEQRLKEGWEISITVHGKKRFRLFRAIPPPIEWGARLEANKVKKIPPKNVYRTNFFNMEILDMYGVPYC